MSFVMVCDPVQNLILSITGMINQGPTLVETKRQKFCQELRKSRRQKTISNQRTLSIVSGNMPQDVYSPAPRVQASPPNSIFEDLPLVKLNNPLLLDLNSFLKLEPKHMVQVLPHVAQPLKHIGQHYKFEPNTNYREKPILQNEIIKPLREVDLRKNRSPAPRLCDSKNRVRLRKNNYTVYQKQLGRGAFSTVFLGRDQSLHREVAVKQISDMVDAEIEVMRQVSSQFIIKMYDFWKKGDKHYIVLELCQGSLKQKRNSLSFEQSCQIFRQILEGMKVLHFHNIIHRDIKLQNILIKDQKVKISDFGLAKNLGSKQKVQSMKCGTPCMMAPQVFFFPNRNTKPVYDSKCDVWSLGVVLHELIYRCHPFGYDFQRVRHCDRIRPNKPVEEIEAILDECLRLDPVDRPDVSQLLRLWNKVIVTKTPKKAIVSEDTETKNVKHMMKKKKLTPALEAAPIVKALNLKRPQVKKRLPDPRQPSQEGLKSPFAKQARAQRCELDKQIDKQQLDKPYIMEEHNGPPKAKSTIYKFKQSIFMAFLFVSVIAIKCLSN